MECAGTDQPRRHRLAKFSCAAILLLSLPICAGCIYKPPGASFRGPLPPTSDEERAAEKRLRSAIEHLAGNIGARVLAPRERFAGTAPGAPGRAARAARSGLEHAEDWLVRELSKTGLAVERHVYTIGAAECANLIVELHGHAAPKEIVIIAAHYDTVPGSPGANDNASGVAALLELVGRFVGATPRRTLRFAFFVNEEAPYGCTTRMGSWQYARACRARGEQIAAMISLDEIGYYSDAPLSQTYPFPLSILYPARGDFLCFVTNAGNRELMFQSVAAFRTAVQFPSEGLAMDVRDVGRSDHWSFWQHGYPGIMVTDSANFRYPHYHQPGDTPDRLDCERLARVVSGLVGVVRELAGIPPTAGD